MSPIEVFHAQHELVREYDVRHVEFFAEDGVLELPFAPPPMPHRVVGRAAIRALLQPRLEAARASGRKLAGYRNLVFHETRDPEVIIVEFEASGVPRPGGGEPYTLPFIMVYRIRDGQIVVQRDYFDSALMVERLRLS